MKDLHVHSYYSDGVSAPNDIVLSAIEKGFKTIGFSDHSFIKGFEDWCMESENESKYYNEISLLKEKYKGQIEILLGIEQDILSGAPTKKYDYVIGSCHTVVYNGKYAMVDMSKEIFIDAVNEIFNGDPYLFCEKYYETVAKIPEVTNCSFIGHIDLITKFNEGYYIFDERHPRYIKAYQSAIDKILKKCSLFEINTGAISRGYRTTAYPSPDIYNYIIKNGGRFILNSDSHHKDTLGFKFEDYKRLITW